MKKLLLLIAIASSLMLTNACKKCKDDPVPDPCATYRKTTAAFTIEEEYHYERRFESDTVMCNNDIYFTAELYGYNYEWRIGNDPTVYNTSVVKLYFPNPTTINVRLIVRRTPVYECDPNDDGIDTLNKTLTVIHGINAVPNQPYPALVGNFKGYYSNDLTTEVTVMIKPYYYNSSATDTTLAIFNWPSPGCSDLSWRSIMGWYSFRAVKLNQGGNVISISCINTSHAWAVVDTTGKQLRIDFNVADASGNLTPRFFTGQKQ